jgi:two-component system, NarL family, nitrate/nitrite response regulator NarL
VDDHPVARHGVAHIFDRCDHITIVSSTDSLAGIPDADVYLVDLYLGEGPVAVEAIAALAARNPVLVMSASARRQDVVSTLEAGASGFLTKASDAGAFIEGVETVAGGGFYLSSQLADIIDASARGAAAGSALAALAPREREVLSYLAQGFTQEQAATRIGIGRSTVDTYVKRIRQKIGPGNRTTLIRRGIEGGHINPVTPQRGPTA